MKSSQDEGFQSESEDSDDELRAALASGELKPGLNVEIEPEREHINNIAGMKAKLEEIYLDLKWVERLDQTNDPALAVPGSTEVSEGAVGHEHNDFKRELLFYRQAQTAVLDALPKLKKLGIPTKRPDDYFAEMAKTDRHMEKVRKKLLSKEIGMEKSQKAKKIRELRKYGKQVQHNVLLQRQKEKRDMIETVKKYRKGEVDKLDFLDDEVETDGTLQKPGGKRKGISRQQRNTKFGFGGRSKFSKRNTADSSASMDYRDSRMKRGFAKGGSKGGSTKGRKGKLKRPGKSSRQKMKANKRK